MSDVAPPPAIDETEDLFAGMKKKKKSKKVNFDNEDDALASAPAPTAASEPVVESTPVVAAASDELDFSDMKKKKKSSSSSSSKKTVRISSNEPSSSPAVDDGDDDEDDGPTTRTIVDKLGNEQVVLITPEEKAAMKAEKAAAKAEEGGDEFSDMKKKKKKGGKKSTFDLEAFEKELADADAVASGQDASSKDATPMGSDGEEGGDDAEFGEEGGDGDGEDPFGAGAEEVQSKPIKAAMEKAWLREEENGRDYTYLELAGQFYMKLYESHPSLSGGAAKKKYKLAPPSIHRDGTKRSIFANVAEICKQMHREPEHVIQFLFAELGTTGSVDGSARLVIKGRFQQKQIETVLRRYIMAYVTCSSCKSGNTLLTKDNRITYISCDSCKSIKSVKAINSGFQAQTGKRRAMRAAA